LYKWINTNGCSRLVFLTRTKAYKLPVLYSWRNFLYGLLNNMNEAETSSRQGTCPVLWKLPFGFLNVMPRTEELSDIEFSNLDVNDFCMHNKIVVEDKRDSFGKLNGKIVAIDYGWPRELHW
jgi:hypothetical protein